MAASRDAGPSLRWSRSAATAAASCSPIPISICWYCCCRAADDALHARSSSSLSACCGISGSKSATACAPSRNASCWPRRTSPCRPACSKRACSTGERRLFRRFEKEFARARPAAILQSQAARAGAAPCALPRHQPRAEHQGNRRRPARPAEYPVDQQGGRHRHALVGSGQARSHHPPRSNAAAQERNISAEPAHPAALSCAPARRAPGVRRADRARCANGIARYRAPARKRASDAAFLPHRDGNQPVEHHRAAEPRHADFPAAHARDTAHQRSFPHPQRIARSLRRRAVPARAQRHARSVRAAAAAPRTERHDRRHAARAVARQQSDQPGIPARPGQPRAVHADPAQPIARRARIAAHEPVRHARPLHSGVRPHRRPDAARPVSRLHRRRAHPQGGAQPAALRGARTRARISAVQPPDERLRAAGTALSRRSVSRHRQGPRRRPLDARQSRRAQVLPRARPAARRRRTRRRGWSKTTW